MMLTQGSNLFGNINFKLRKNNKKLNFLKMFLKSKKRNSYTICELRSRVDKGPHGCTNCR
jgi:hypothetical protein